ncbi:MAG: ankyrin repeat domain-containing protein [Phycisphaerales bacterium JB038]
MRRVVCFGILLVVLSLATTVAAAWVFASFEVHGNPPHRLVTLSSERGRETNSWSVRQWCGRGTRFYLREPMSEIRRAELPRAWRCLPQLDVPGWSVASTPAGPQDKTVLEDLRGWPFLSLRCRWELPSRGLPDYFTVPEEVLTGGIVITPFAPDWLYGDFVPIPADSRRAIIDIELWNATEHRALPCIPLWRGVILSTLTYSLAWIPIIFLLSFPGTLRRGLRRRRSRCIHCGYSLRSIDSLCCPECGRDRSQRLPILTNGRIAIAGSLVFLVVGFDMTWAAELHRRFHGPPAIHLAARNNNVARLDDELRRGANPELAFNSDELDYSGVTGSTPLIWAAAHSSCQAMRLLIDHGADPNAAVKRSVFGEITALEFAVESGSAEAVDVLLQAGAHFDPATSRAQSLFVHAAYNAPVETLKVMVAAGAIIDAPRDAGYTPLCAAAASGDLDKVSFLLALGADVNPPTRSPPLLGAARAGALDVVRLLKENGARAPRGDDTMLLVAADKGHLELARYLIEYGADVNYETWPGTGETPLQRAVERADVELVRMLLDAGADPGVPDHEDLTTLDLALAYLRDTAENLGSEAADPEQRIVDLIQTAMEGR